MGRNMAGPRFISGPIRRLLACAAIVAAAGGTATARAADADLGVNVFGFSHHLDVGDGSGLREFNPGAGLQWRFARSPRASLDANLGVYGDSFGHANWHLSLGARVRVLGALSVGAQMINAVSPSLNDGYPVLTPYPLATVSLPRADLHVAYIPEVRSFNGIATVATFATIYPWGGDDDEVARADDSPDWQALEFTVEGLGGLDGFSGNGIAWRHMLDDRHGLRLGVQLAGELRSAEFPNGVEAPMTGEYSGTLLMQYLRRAAPHGRLRPYWAAGLAHSFRADLGVTDLDLRLQGNLGVEYELTPGLSLAAETGLVARYRRQIDHDWLDRERRSVELKAGEARMLLVARRDGGGHDGVAATGGAAAQPPRGSSLLFMVGWNLKISPLEEGAVAWRNLDESGRGWRFMVIPRIQTEDENAQYRDYDLTVRAEHVRHHAVSGSLGAYWGFGPLVGYSYHEDKWPGHLSVNRSLGVGVGAVIGAEYDLTRDIHLLAEYQASASWSRVHWGWGPRESRWNIGNDAARLGLAISLGGGADRQ